MLFFATLRSLYIRRISTRDVAIIPLYRQSTRSARYGDSERRGTSTRRREHSSHLVHYAHRNDHAANDGYSGLSELVRKPELGQHERERTSAASVLFHSVIQRKYGICSRLHCSQANGSERGCAASAAVRWSNSDFFTSSPAPRTAAHGGAAFDERQHHGMVASPLEEEAPR
jgi:hypothetical protein